MNLLGTGHRLVERHFAGHSSPREDGRMWRHLAQCNLCRARYRAHSLLEALTDEPDAAARARIGRSLFPQTSVQAGTPWLFPWSWAQRGLGAGALGLALALLLLLRARPDDFGVRGVERSGEPSAAPSIALFRIDATGASTRLGALLHSHDALAVAYRNRVAEPFTHLLVFALDARGNVYWLAPSWSDPASDPEAVPIAHGAAQHELRAAVRHALPQGALRVVALFANSPSKVRAIEAALADPAVGIEGLPGMRVELSLRVDP